MSTTERKRAKDIERVRSTAANPSASRAGLITEHIVPNSDERPKGELGLNDIVFTVIEGRHATLRLGKEQTGLLTQDDLLSISKTVDQLVQGTA